MEQHKSTFITNHSNQPVLQAYKELHKTIDEMDNKVEHVIKKHQAQFLIAYRNHIAKIKKQLAEIKHKSQEQEKMFSANDRIQYLQKEMVIFREEALKLYSKLDEKTQENDLLRSRVKQLQKEQMMVQLQEKQQMRSVKMQDMNKTLLQAKIVELQEQLDKKDMQISKMNKKVDSLAEQLTERTKPANREHKNSSEMTSTRRGDSLKLSFRRHQASDSEMKDWFLDCIRTVKRQVSMRNHSGIMLDINAINSIQQFKTVDKLRLLELLLQNEKLLSWLYERIFPDRMALLRQKVSSQHDETSRVHLNDPANYEKRGLPRVNKVVRSELRYSMLVRNGKLNISQV